MAKVAAVCLLVQMGEEYRGYSGSADLSLIDVLIKSTLSEPYSIWTYYYFLEEFPYLCRTVCHGVSWACQ